ncbi:Putative glycosyl hydrolase of uncharacterised function (DUF1680) [Kluyvera cryocrescens]|uniref:Glycosyl hydrolase of uncharacterized function (DUF1680) n=1 Tax=Kluyvera cryocrescens TaxID=580 RepID=A0A485AZ05_KLUCR|nr:Putative glycosyl hydrolase of uncharacterised function (DUF1680) [Kluyvera cryocrescens]
MKGDTLTLTLPMPVRRVYGNPLVRHVAGKVAIQRGPLFTVWSRPIMVKNCITCGCLKTPRSLSSKAKGIFAHKVLLQAQGVKRTAQKPGTTIAVALRYRSRNCTNTDSDFYPLV